MQKAKQPGQPIDNPPVNCLRWYPPQLVKEFKDEETFVIRWIDAKEPTGIYTVYPEIEEHSQREAVLKLAWQRAQKNIEDNDKAGTPIVEKKK